MRRRDGLNVLTRVPRSYRRGGTWHSCMSTPSTVLVLPVRYRPALSMNRTLDIRARHGVLGAEGTSDRSLCRPDNGKGQQQGADTESGFFHLNLPSLPTGLDGGDSPVVQGSSQ